MVEEGQRRGEEHASFRAPSAIRDWHSVQRSYGPDASNDERYRHYFVRDFQTAREHTQSRYPEIALRGLDTAMRLQATRYNSLTEGRRGRYPHEWATVDEVDGQPVSEEMKKVIKSLAADWGGTEEELLYYGSEDATPMTVVGALQFYQEFGDWYKEEYGKDYLEEEITTQSGEKLSRRESLIRGLEHVSDRIAAPAKGYPSIGLLGYKRINSKGHNNQVWMDSPAAYMRPDGELPNYDGPLFAVELQGYAYDAYAYALDVLGDLEPEKARLWKDTADKIQQQTLSLLWNDDEKTFAMGLDMDPRTKKPRRIDVNSINVGELLKSRIFDNLSEEQQAKYVGNSWNMLTSEGFVTPVGLRCRDMRQGTPTDYKGYHNENFVWIKASHNVAEAGRKWGFIQSANQLDTLHINYVNIAGDDLELSFVDGEGRPDYDPKKKRLLDIVNTATIETVAVESVPEAMQTWTSSSILQAKFENTRRYWQKTFQNMMRSHDGDYLRQVKADLPDALRPVWDDALKTLNDQRPDWVKETDAQASDRIPYTDLLKTREQIAEAFPTEYAFYLDTKEGSKRREKVLQVIYDEKTAAHSF